MLVIDIDLPDSSLLEDSQFVANLLVIFIVAVFPVNLGIRYNTAKF